MGNKANAWAALLLSLAIILVLHGLYSGSVPELLGAIVFIMLANFIKTYWT
jgi:hypothetical protein